MQLFRKRAHVPQFRPKAQTRSAPLRAALVVVVVVASLSLASNRAAAYCGGLSYSVGTYKSGGYMSSSGLTQNTGYVQGFYPDPVVSNSTAWYNLTIPSTYTYAQTGWVRTPSWTTYYVFAQWRSGINDSAHSVIQYVTPTYSHNYDIKQLGGSTAYEFSFNFSPWLDTINLNWSPTQLEAAAETLNHADHFPGSAAPGPYVEFWGGTHTVYGLNYPNSLSPYESVPSTDVVGTTWLNSNDFYVWDKRCSDGG